MRSQGTAEPSAIPPSAAGNSWISKTPGVCGGNACIRNTRITVWGLVERRDLGMSDDQMVQDIHGLTRDDLATAWQYYDEHREEIHQTIHENNED